MRLASTLSTKDTTVTTLEITEIYLGATHLIRCNLADPWSPVEIYRDGQWIETDHACSKVRGREFDLAALGASLLLEDRGGLGDWEYRVVSENP